MIKYEEALGQARKLVENNPEIDDIYDSFQAPLGKTVEVVDKFQEKVVVTPDNYSLLLRDALLGYVHSATAQEKLDKPYDALDLEQIADALDGVYWTYKAEKNREKFPPRTPPPDDGTVKGNL